MTADYAGARRANDVATCVRIAAERLDQLDKNATPARWKSVVNPRNPDRAGVMVMDDAPYWLLPYGPLTTDDAEYIAASRAWAQPLAALLRDLLRDDDGTVPIYSLLGYYRPDERDRLLALTDTITGHQETEEPAP